MERALDLLARKIGMDPIELRRRNIITPGEFPYDNGAGFTYDSANYPLLLDTLEKAGGYRDAIQWKVKFNQFAKGANSSLIAGVGICAEIEDTGSQFSETARLLLKPSGDLILYTGSSPHGQGLETTLAQIVAEELSVPMERVRVVYGDTDLIPSGVGTFGSRSIAAGGSAALDAARKLKIQLIESAAEISGLRIEEVKFQNGSLLDPSGATFLGITDLFTKLNVEELQENSEYRMSQSTFASGAHMCTLVVDAETGKIMIQRYVAVDDAGRVINRVIVDGQIHGGVVHGIAGAIYEELRYDADARPLVTNFMDYLVPTAVESPKIEIHHIETPSTITLDGARGVGESGTIAAYPAVFNALEDALREIGATGLKVAPASPERVRAAIARVGSSSTRTEARMSS